MQGTNVLGTATFRNTQLRIQDSTDQTKLVAFDASGLTTSTTRTWTAPDADGTVAFDHTLDHNVYGWNVGPSGNSQTISDATWTNVKFVANEDPGSNFSQPTYTLPVDGIYRVEGTISWDGNGTGVRQFKVVTTGSLTSEFLLDRRDANATAHTTNRGSVILHGLQANDTITFQARQTSGGDLDLIGLSGSTYECFFSIEYLGAQ